MHAQDVTYRMKYNNIGIPMTTPTNMKTERSTYHEIFSKNWRKWYNVKIWKNSRYDKRRIDKLTRCNFPVNNTHMCDMSKSIKNAQSRLSQRQRNAEFQLKNINYIFRYRFDTYIITYSTYVSISYSNKISTYKKLCSVIVLSKTRIIHVFN